MAEDNGSSFSLIKLDGKAIEKLIEVVSAGIGTLYKPRAIRREAEAKAYELEVMAQAEARSLIIRSDSESEVVERAKQRLYHQEINRQRNLDNIIESSVEHLNQEVSDKPVDEEWRTRFFNKAQDISSADLQEVWGKILANEINNPGNFSLRTIDILSNLSKREAEIFIKFGPYFTRDGYMLKDDIKDFEKLNISYAELLIMRSSGIIIESDTLAFTKKKSAEFYVKTENEEISKMGVAFKYLRHAIWISNDNIEKMPFSCYGLTNSGRELLNIIQYEEDFKYLQDLKETFEQRKFEVYLVKL
jgi:hypothetical protein